MSFDPATLLPPPAAAIFTRLRDKALDLHGAAMGARQRLEDAREERARLRGTINSIANMRGWRNVEHKEKLEGELRTLTEKFAKASSAYSERVERWQAVSAVVRAVETYIGDLPKTASIATHDGTAPKIKDLAGARRRIEQIKAEIDAVRGAPLPSADLVRRAMAEIDVLATRGEPSVNALFAEAGGVEWPMVSLFLRVSGAPVAVNGEAIDSLALLAWLHRDALKKKIAALIEEQADEESAIPASKRPKMIADLRADLLEVERAECAAVEAANTDDYRADTDPRALLGLADSLPPPRDER